MRTRVAVLTALILCIAFIARVPDAAAENPQNSDPLPVLEIADDFYVIQGEGSNVSVYVTDEGLILVDDKFDRTYDQLQAALRSFTDQPVKYVINTHPHGDHSGGNASMPASTVLVAHVNAAAAMVRNNQPGLPEMTYADQMTISLGGKEAIVYHFGPCHTDGDSFVYFPAVRVLSSGDCFNTGNGRGENTTGSPTFAFYIDYNTGGSFAGRETVGDSALGLDFDTVVPGHGPVTDREGFTRWRAQIASIRWRVTQMLRDNQTKEEIVGVLESDEYGWQEGGRASTNSIDGMIDELKPE